MQKKLKEGHARIAGGDPLREEAREVGELGRRQFLPGWFSWLGHGGTPRGQKS